MRSMMIAFTIGMRSKLISITASYCLARHSVFTVRSGLIQTDGRHLQH